MATALILETTTPVGSICLVDADGGLFEREFGSDRRHNAALFGPLQELLGGVVELDLVLVGSGPGSYSGTRVGIAAAQGVAMAMNCPAVAVPSALAIEPVSRGAACLIVGDARRGIFWSARIGASGMEDPVLESEKPWQQTLSLAMEEGLELVSFEDPSSWPLPEQVEVSRVIPKASLLWQAWQRSGPATRDDWQGRVPQPIYLKPPHITQAKHKVLRPGS